MSKFINKNVDNSIHSNEPHSEYSDHIYVAESESKEQLYDRNNPIVKIILIAVGSVAVIGTIYYLLTALGTLK